MKKRLWSSILKRGILICIVLGLLCIHFYVPRVITEIKNPVITAIRPATSKTVSGFNENPENGKLITFTSFDNTVLTAFLTYSKLDTVKGTIILLHGIRGYKEHFVELSQQLSKKGYHTIALDLRAHGASKGQHCTFGVKEKKDIVALTTVLIEQEKLDHPIGIWGQSLGGAIGLQTMGIDQRIKFGIIESTFTNFRTITNDYIQYHLGVNSKIVTDYLVNRAGNIADFDPDEAIPLDYCERINQPILIVHGTADKRIKIEYGRQNFDQIKSSKKELIAVKDANHLSVWSVGGDQYFNTVFQFIESSTLE